MTYRICFVCTGNICRSPMAEVVLRHRLVEAGLDGQVEVDSAGTGDWHVGGGADHRALRTLTDAGYDGGSHRARQFDRRWFAERDLVVALDRGHLRALRAMAPTPEDADKVQLLRSFSLGSDGTTDLDVPDPYYGGSRDFAEVLEQVESACTGLVDHLVRTGAVARA